MAKPTGRVSSQSQGREAVWQRCRQLTSSKRGKGKNLHTTLNKICLRAGVAPWQKPFQNLRSTQATNLAADIPLKTVCEWLGHDALVAIKLNQQVGPDHWERALKSPDVMVQEKAQDEPAEVG